MGLESRQFEGRSAAEAAIKACESLGVTRSELQYSVVSESGDGLDRRVVIEVSAVVSRGREAGAADTSRGVARAEEGRGGGHAARGPRREGSHRSDDRRGGRGEARGGRGGGRGRDRAHGSEREPAGGVDALLELSCDAGSTEAVVRPVVEGTLTPRAQQAREVAGKILELAGFELQAVVVADGPEEVEIDLRGPDSTRAIGKSGEVLMSLQFLVNRLVSRAAEGEQVVVLDVVNYRARRHRALEELARRLATRAIEEGRAVRLSAMSAHDRRVFHLTLKDHEGVSTRSEGEGLFRRMLIIPSGIS